jgi:hypothetical protein
VRLVHKEQPVTQARLVHKGHWETQVFKEHKEQQDRLDPKVLKEILVIQVQQELLVLLDRKDL